MNGISGWELASLLDAQGPPWFKVDQEGKFVLVHCTWCQRSLPKKKQQTKDHVIPRMFARIRSAPSQPQNNIVMACSTCNGERGQIHDFYRYVLNIDHTRLKPCLRAWQKKAAMTLLWQKWVALEKRALGWSFTESLDLANVPLFVNTTQQGLANQIRMEREAEILARRGLRENGGIRCRVMFPDQAARDARVRWLNEPNGEQALPG